MSVKGMISAANKGNLKTFKKHFDAALANRVAKIVKTRLFEENTEASEILEAEEDDLEEGYTKRSMEDRAEQLCSNYGKCDGGASLNPEDHEPGCPAKKYIEDPGSDA